MYMGDSNIKHATPWPPACLQRVKHASWSSVSLPASQVGRQGVKLQ